jgi:hypothetical protein
MSILLTLTALLTVDSTHLLLLTQSLLVTLLEA